MGGAPMPEDVVKQYVKMPEAVSKKDAATKEVAKEGVKEEKQVSNNDANAQSTAPTATAHVYDLEEDSDDDDDDDDDEPSGVVMEPPLSPPPPQGIQARIGLYNWNGSTQHILKPMLKGRQLYNNILIGILIYRYQ